MGHNLDLISLLGLPDKIKCHNCNNEIPSRFDEYDIDCGNPEASYNDGLLCLDVYCTVCDHTTEFKVECHEVKT